MKTKLKFIQNIDRLGLFEIVETLFISLSPITIINNKLWKYTAKLYFQLYNYLVR